ncbi:MAG: diguanylate cyclase (GGDEF)-like protein [Sulfurimonas sp.]|jgi:diguanylate cyclase (GGDEF)-like protein|uniref:EAL domain-containing response regulator n=1 Tax=Sulfurimonas sp. TaxID=2022749 RepID=UPI0039E6CFF3
MKREIEQCMEYSKKLNILYVEDNLNARTFTLDILKRFFNNISIAKDGKEGLKIFKNSKFDLVLTDINMPNMNGLEMAKAIKAIDNSTVILILSAHNETEYFISSIKLGIDGFLLKPIELTQFIDTLNKVVEKIHLKKELQLYQFELEESNENLEKKVQERIAALEYRLFHDQLTELGNHELMMEKIGKTRYETIILIDINGFQKFNDLYGLNAGNTILKEFSMFLDSINQDERYSLYRIYGDVFVMLSSSNTEENKCYKEDLKDFFTSLKALKIYLEEIEDEVDLEVTIGISFEKEKSFIKAGMALKHAKKENKHFLVYTEKIDNSKQLVNDMYWKKEIKTAIENNGIIPVFQGIVDINGQVVKYETLMRLIQYKENKEELIPPLFFLAASVKTKQYDKLTKIMIEKSFQFMSDKTVDFSINLSFEDFADPHRVEYIHNKILQYGVGKRLIMEVLESEVVSDYEMVTDILNSFRKYGVRVAIDDFGSGFSNFEHILKLNPDYIKIDSSLIKNILTEEKPFTLVKAIAEFSKKLGIKVIAEHVSSKEIFDILKELSIDEYQGYHFSVPSKSLELIKDV